MLISLKSCNLVVNKQLLCIIHSACHLHRYIRILSICIYDLGYQFHLFPSRCIFWSSQHSIYLQHLESYHVPIKWFSLQLLSYYPKQEMQLYLVHQQSVHCWLGPMESDRLSYCLFSQYCLHCFKTIILDFIFDQQM